MSPATDLYAVALLALELLYDARPFDADGFHAILQRKLDRGFDPSESLPPEVPDDLRVRFRRALASDPAERYQSCDELRQLIHDALERRDSPAATTAPEPMAQRPTWLPWLVAGALAVAVAFMALRPSATPDSQPVPTASVTSTTTASATPALDKPALAWVRIEGGRFQLGLTDGDDYAGSFGKPEGPTAHYDVEVATYQLSRAEITIAQYRACVVAGACTPPERTVADGPNFRYGRAGFEAHPVSWLTWTQAHAFCSWVGARLPTELEWEYAARSRGQPRIYPWGDDSPTCDRAVFHRGEAVGCGRGTTWAVCSKPAGNTREGLCDMAGNVREWTADCGTIEESRANPKPHAKASANDPAWKCERMVRGGSFETPWDGANDVARPLRTTERDAEGQHWSFGDLGFRCARGGQRHVE